jgi:hypothetical protein
VSAVTEIQSDQQLESRIAGALRARRGRATLADVVVDTGLPNLEAERMLRRMIGDYPCHLEVTEDGDILYEFAPAVRRHDELGRGRRLLRRVGERLWAGFRVFMKALIAIVLVVYFVLFVVLIIAAMVAASRASDNRGRRMPRMGGGGDGGMFWFWFWVFGRRDDPYRRHHRHNPSYSRWSRTSREGKDDRPFYLKVYSFVLGPEPGDVEPLDDDRALLAYVREKNGAVTPAEVASRTGWSLKDTEQILTRMVARYEGNLAISDEGTLVFTFADLRKTAGAKQAGKAPAFWERWEQKLALTGNSSGTNVMVGGLNTFNLFAALAAPTMILPPLQMEPTFGLLFALHYFPIGFSVLLFLVPTLRWLLHVRPANGRRRHRNFRRGAYATVYGARRTGRPWLPPAVFVKRTREALDKQAYAPEPTDGALEPVVTEVARDLGADLLPERGDGLTELEGELGWRFDELEAEYEAAARVRQELAREQSHVRVVFSTRTADPLGEVEADALASKTEKATKPVLH